MILPIDALVMETLDCDILVGLPFCKDNDVEVHLKKDEISIRGTRIPYGAKISANHTIYAAESFLLCNDSAKVLFPGEFLELHSDSLSGYNGEISIEPRFDSPNNGEWPEPTVSRVIQETIRIPNSSTSPIQLSKSQHFAQICRVITPNILEDPNKLVISSKSEKKLPTQYPVKGTGLIVLDPDNMLSDEEKLKFHNLHVAHEKVFQPDFGVYNDKSGVIRADINLGPMVPPP